MRSELQIVTTSWMRLSRHSPATSRGTGSTLLMVEESLLGRFGHSIKFTNGSKHGRKAYWLKLSTRLWALSDCLDRLYALTESPCRSIGLRHRSGSTRTRYLHG